MTLHPAVARDVIEREAETVRLRFGDLLNAVVVDGSYVYLEPRSWDGRWLRLDGAEYDQQPFRIAVVDGDMQPLPGPQWPGHLHYGQHPLLKVPWACIRGTYEYHSYPGHAAEVWDQFRPTLRMRHLVSHILRKAAT